MSNEKVKAINVPNSEALTKEECRFLLEVLNQQGLAFPATARKVLNSTMDKLEAVFDEAGN